MQSFPRKIRVDVAKQQLDVVETTDSGEAVLARFPVSTSRFGLGSEPGSNRTPLGRFVVDEKFGDGAELGTVFESRQPTGEVAPFESPEDPRDCITTRILWLSGQEPHNANTKERYVYIHGTNHEEVIGEPQSHGCVRMRNADVARLYELVARGVEVLIEA
ncbi:MAG: L,D-transpeptidase family protein [Chthoniobacteraceae bacterium]